MRSLKVETSVANGNQSERLVYFIHHLHPVTLLKNLRFCDTPSTFPNTKRKKVQDMSFSLSEAWSIFKSETYPGPHCQNKKTNQNIWKKKSERTKILRRKLRTKIGK